jgi:hypothetical protein
MWSRWKWKFSCLHIQKSDAFSRELVQFILDYGAVDGSHHKQYALDQVLRKLTGDDYEEVIKEWCNGEDGPETYTWDEGIAP